MDREQAFRFLRRGGFIVEHAGGEEWSITIAFPEAPEISLQGQGRDKHRIIRFTELLYQAYRAFVYRKASAMMHESLNTQLSSKLAANIPRITIGGVHERC